MTNLGERADAKRNRERIIEAARDLFAARGLEVEVREICERSGVGIATLYRNFATKDDLIVAIIEQVNDEVEAGLTQASGQDDPERALTVLLDSLFMTVDRYHELARALRHATHLENLERRESLVAQTASIFRRARRAGIMRSDVDPRILADMLGGFTMIYMELLNTASQPVARDAVTRLLWSALRGSPNDVPPGARAPRSRPHPIDDSVHA